MFCPLAWLKLLFFCHAGETEVGGFAVSSADDPLYVEDFLTVRQFTSSVSVEFDDNAVADYFDAAVDRGLNPSRFARMWCHTHPGDSAHPSSTDEHTFARVFGACDWSIMFILSRTGQTYARLSFAAGPGGSLMLPVEVDWAAWPQIVLEQATALGALVESWAAEFEQNVHPVAFFAGSHHAAGLASAYEDEWSIPLRLHEAQAMHEQRDDEFLRLVEAEQELMR